jgi:hypothetical protein
MSSKKIQRGGNCNLGACPLQMGGSSCSSNNRKLTQMGGSSCSSNNRKLTQMGGKKSNRSRKNKKSIKRSKRSKVRRGGALRSGSEVSIRNK